MGVGTGTLKSWIDRASDVINVSDGVYQIADSCLRLHLSAKSEIKPILPMLILGNEAEQLVARQMAAAGFNLLYLEKLRWFPLLALVIEKQVCFYDIRRLQAKGGSCRIDEKTVTIDNLLTVGI